MMTYIEMKKRESTVATIYLVLVFILPNDDSVIVI